MMISLTCYLFIMQPPIINALGAVSNVSSPIIATPERPDRTLPAVSMSSLVRVNMHFLPMLLIAFIGIEIMTLNEFCRLLWKVAGLLMLSQEFLKILKKSKAGS